MSLQFDCLTFQMFPWHVRHTMLSHGWLFKPVCSKNSIHLVYIIIYKVQIYKRHTPFYAVHALSVHSLYKQVGSESTNTIFGYCILNMQYEYCSWTTRELQCILQYQKADSDSTYLLSTASQSSSTMRWKLVIKDMITIWEGNALRKQRGLLLVIQRLRKLSPIVVVLKSATLNTQVVHSTIMAANAKSRIV